MFDTLQAVAFLNAYWNEVGSQAEFIFGCAYEVLSALCSLLSPLASPLSPLASHLSPLPFVLTFPLL
jgi:hypothetical protein